MNEEERRKAMSALSSMGAYAVALLADLRDGVWQPNSEPQIELNDAIFRYFETLGWPRWAGTSYDDMP